MLYNSCLVALRVARKSAPRVDPLAESFLRGCDLSRCAGHILCVAVTSFRGELYGGFMSAPRRGQVVKSFLNAPSGEGTFRRCALERGERTSASTREIGTKARGWRRSGRSGWIEKENTEKASRKQRFREVHRLFTEGGRLLKRIASIPPRD